MATAPSVAITLAACLAIGGLNSAPASARPARIVSMNLCADELVLRLADRDQIAAVSWLARDARDSTVAAEAAGLPVSRGLAEEIAGLSPDLVIAGAYTTRPAVMILKRLGIPVLELGLPGSFDDVRSQIRLIAAALGQQARGEALVADLDTRLSAILPSPNPLRALVLSPNGFTVEPGSLGDAILRRAGLVNVAAEIGRDRMGQVPLELVALSDSDLIVLDESEEGTSLADALLRHPVLVVLRQAGRTLPLPNRYWTCAGPHLAEAVSRLAEAGRSRSAMPRSHSSQHP